MAAEKKPAREGSANWRVAIDLAGASLRDGRHSAAAACVSYSCGTLPKPVGKDKGTHNLGASNSAGVLPKRVRPKWLSYKTSKKSKVMGTGR